MQNKNKKNYCPDCDMPSTYHIQTWLEELIGRLPFLNSAPKKIEALVDIFLKKLLVALRLAKWKNDFTTKNIRLRSILFINEAEKMGIKFKVFHGPFGYTNHFQMKIGKSKFYFDGLPTADFLNKNKKNLADKELTRKYLKKGGFPVVEGKSFWFFQKRKAHQYAKKIGFPLVVKPRSGSLSRHTTTDIRSIPELNQAIHWAIIYSPNFIIEKFVQNVSTYRITVIDFNNIYCVKQIPANIIGNGKSTIRQLIDEKNNNPYRGEKGQNGFILQKIVEDDTTKNLLKKKNYNFSSIPLKNETVYLQKNSFLKLGGDLIDVTDKIHPDNLKMFYKIAKFFDIRIVGIDFLCQNIASSWKNQTSVILELNDLPCIEMHHFPSQGKAQNIARAITNMVLKYYK